MDLFRLDTISLGKPGARVQVAQFTMDRDSS